MGRAGPLWHSELARLEVEESLRRLHFPHGRPLHRTTPGLPGRDGQVVVRCAWALNKQGVSRTLKSFLGRFGVFLRTVAFGPGLAPGALPYVLGCQLHGAANPKVFFKCKYKVCSFQSGPCIGPLYVFWGVDPPHFSRQIIFIHFWSRLNIVGG